MNQSILAFVAISRIYNSIMKSGELKHEMTLFHTIEMFCYRHTFFLWTYMVSFGALLTQDDVGPFESPVTAHQTLSNNA